MLNEILKVTKKVPIHKMYSEPRIFCGGGNISEWDTFTNKQQKERLKKDWYVTFSYRHPDTGKLTPQPRIKRGNNFKTKKERHKVLEYYRKAISEALKDGFNPYLVKDVKKSNSVQDSFNRMLEIKQKEVSEKYFYSIKSTCNKFIEYLENESYNTSDVSKLNKQTVNSFLDHILITVSSKTRNDYRDQLKGVFDKLEQHNLIKNNFIRNIPNIKRKKKRSSTYSENQVKEITKYLKNKDPQLLLFIKFVSYTFLRPIEVCRLTVSDIDLIEKTIKVKTKTNELKTKIIPDILFKDIENYISESNYNANYLLFTPKGIGEWKTREEGRRYHYTRKYGQVKKELEIGTEYNIYSFRHTFITKIYKYLKSKGLSKTQAEDELCLITGHESKAFKNYLHNLDAERPQDYSDGLLM